MITDDPAEKPRCRVISVAEKLTHLDAYDEAIRTHEGGAYLRVHGLYSSQITQWCKQRDAGMFDGKQPGQAIGKRTKEQAEIARLKRQLAERERDLETTQTALDTMERAHALLEHLSKGADSLDLKRNKG